MFRQLDESGARVEVKEGVIRIYDPTEKLIAKVLRGVNHLYTMRITQGELECNLVSICVKSRLWHERFGHLNYLVQKKLGQDKFVRGVCELEPKSKFVKLV